MLSQSHATLHQTKDADPVKAGGIYFKLELSRMPKHADDLSRYNTYHGLFGRNMLERMNLYMYIFDEIAKIKAAIAADKTGNDIQFSCLIIFRGQQGNKALDVTFTDIASFHEFIATHHLIPNKDDSQMQYSYKGNDGKTVVGVFADHEQYKHYLATHVTHPIFVPK